MRHPYIRKNQCRIHGIYFTSPGYLNNRICISCLILAWNLLQNAEFLCFSKKLFLIRSAASGLTVTLPNMDRMAGGELE